MAKKNKVNEFEKFKDLVLSEYKKGNIVISDFDGIKSANFDELMNQPIDGVLYDINRNEAVILTFIENQKWINDYAATMVIKRLYSENQELKRQLSEKK